MAKFYITTDSTCDYPIGHSAEDFATVALSYTMDGAVSEDGYRSDEHAHSFYDSMREGKLPTTSLIPPEKFISFLTPILSAGNDVLHVAFSSGLSGTYSSCMVALDELRERFPERKIFVVDSLCASLGEALLVDLLIDYRKNHTIEETKKYAEKTKGKINHYFTVDSLKHLQRGGRISKLTAIVGQIVKIKPVLHANHEGKLIALGKVISRRLSLKWLAEKLERFMIAEETPYVYICHGDCIEDAERLAKMINERTGKEVKLSYTGAVIGSHSGPGTLAVFFVGKDRYDGKNESKEN